MKKKITESNSICICIQRNSKNKYINDKFKRAEKNANEPNQFQTFPKRRKKSFIW